MVILIGGVSCTGKTVLAQRLLEKYKIPYLSIDHIKMGLILGSKYCDFSSTDSDDELTKKLWPIVKGIIKVNIENEQNIIIEGCYIPPEHIGDFEDEYLKEIISVYLGFSKNYIDNYFDIGIIKHLREIEKKELDDDYINRGNFINLHAKLKERCRKNNALFFEIDNNYEIEIVNVYKYIDEQVEAIKKKKPGLDSAKRPGDERYFT